MAIKIEDLDLHPVLTWEELLVLIFGYDAVDQLDSMYHPNGLGPTINAIKIFEGWIHKALISGQIRASNPYDDNNRYLRSSTFQRDDTFQWIHKNKIFDRLEREGAEISKALKEAVEVTAKTEPTQPKTETPAPKDSKRGPKAKHNWGKVEDAVKLVCKNKKKRPGPAQIFNDPIVQKVLSLEGDCNQKYIKDEISKMLNNIYPEKAKTQKITNTGLRVKGIINKRTRAENG